MVENIWRDVWPISIVQGDLVLGGGIGTAGYDVP